MTSKCKSEPSSLSGSNESLNSNPVLSGAQAQSISGLFDCNTREKQEVTSSPQSEALDEQMLALNIQDEVAEALEEDDEEAGDELSVIDGHDHSDPVSAQHVPFVSSYDRLCALESSLSRDLVGHANFRQMPLAMQQNIKQVAHVLDNTVNSFDEKSLSEEECCELTAKLEWFVGMKQKEMAWIEQNIVKATQHLPNVLHHYQSKRPIEQNDGDILLLLGEVAATKVTLDFLEKGSVYDDDCSWFCSEQLKGMLIASIGHVRAFAACNKEAIVRIVDTVPNGHRSASLFIMQGARARPFALPEPVNSFAIVECNRTNMKVSWEWSASENNRKYLTGVAVMRRFPAVDGQENEWHIVDVGPSTDTSYTFRNLEPGQAYEFGVASGCDAGYCVPTTCTASTRKAAAPAELMLQYCRLQCKNADGLDWFTLPLTQTFADCDREHMLRKLEVGYPSEPRENKVLLVVGASGSGKSTLIAAMINYMYGVELHDQHRLLLMVENTGRNQAHSQTTQITAFQMHWMPGMRVPFTLTVIDTPGFGDTEGLGRDKEITGQLRAAFESPDLGLTYLNGVAFVAQAGTNRLTAAQKYVFDSILAVFGKDVAPNIFVMATFSDDKRPQLVDALAEHKFPHQQIFAFNNSSFMIDHSDPATASAAANVIGFKRETMGKMYWDMVQHSFQVFFQKFGQMSPVSLQMSREVLNERGRLELKIVALRNDVNRGVSEMQLARTEYTIMEHLSQTAMANKDHTIENIVIRQRRVPTANHTTTCMDCDKTCHENCIYANDEDKAKCSAMDGRHAIDSTCVICPKRCGWQRHNNRKFIIEDYEEIVTETMAEMKAKYDEGIQGLSTKGNLLLGIAKRYRLVQQQVIRDVTESRNCLARLDDIGLRPHPLSLVECIDQMIESVKNEMPRKPNWQGRLDELANARDTAQIMENMLKLGQHYDPLADATKLFDEMLNNEPELLNYQALNTDSAEHSSKITNMFQKLKKFVFGSGKKKNN